MGRLRKMLAVFVATGMFTAGLVVAAAGPASADYGRGAVYQVEISANNVGGVPGDGAWIWIALNEDGTGDYTMADCVHTGSLLGHPGLNAAAHSRGDVTWTDDGTNLTIVGVGAIGGLVPVTIVVPDVYGHYVLDSASTILVPPNPIFEGFGGWAQVQIAP
jgi:hypothetical protein